MATHPRYRVDAGAHCIDVRLTSIEQLFDNRDPAPFRSRDLDPDLLEYLVAAGEDLLAAVHLHAQQLRFGIAAVAS